MIILGPLSLTGDAHKTVTWGRILPAARLLPLEKRSVSGREKLSAQGFWRNHSLHWIKVQKENLG